MSLFDEDGDSLAPSHTFNSTPPGPDDTTHTSSNVLVAGGVEAHKHNVQEAMSYGAGEGLAIEKSEESNFKRIKLDINIEAVSERDVDVEFNKGDDDVEMEMEMGEEGEQKEKESMGVLDERAKRRIFGSDEKEHGDEDEQSQSLFNKTNNISRPTESDTVSSHTSPLKPSSSSSSSLTLERITNSNTTVQASWKHSKGVLFSDSEDENEESVSRRSNPSSLQNSPGASKLFSVKKSDDDEESKDSMDDESAPTKVMKRRRLQRKRVSDNSDEEEREYDENSNNNNSIEGFDENETKSVGISEKSRTEKGSIKDRLQGLSKARKISSKDNEESSSFSRRRSKKSTKKHRKGFSSSDNEEEMSKDGEEPQLPADPNLIAFFKETVGKDFDMEEFERERRMELSALAKYNDIDPVIEDQRSQKNGHDLMKELFGSDVDADDMEEGVKEKNKEMKKKAEDQQNKENEVEEQGEDELDSDMYDSDGNVILDDEKPKHQLLQKGQRVTRHSFNKFYEYFYNV
jgi:hypothetical protein